MHHSWSGDSPRESAVPIITTLCIIHGLGIVQGSLLYLLSQHCMYHSWSGDSPRESAVLIITALYASFEVHRGYLLWRTID